MSNTILFLQSINDDLTKRREARLKRHKSLSQYSLAFCYVLGGDLVFPDDLDISHGPRIKASLASRLISELATQTPELLIVHAGIAFRRFPREVWDVLSNAKTKFPNIPFGLLETDDTLAIDSEFYNFVRRMRRSSSIFEEHQLLTTVRRVFE